MIYVTNHWDRRLDFAGCTCPAGPFMVWLSLIVAVRIGCDRISRFLLMPSGLGGDLDVFILNRTFLQTRTRELSLMCSAPC